MYLRSPQIFQQQTAVPTEGAAGFSYFLGCEPTELNDAKTASKSPVGLVYKLCLLPVSRVCPLSGCLQILRDPLNYGLTPGPGLV